MEQKSTTKRYCKYTREVRVKLIAMVQQEDFSTAHAARLLGIKQTSACRIVNSFRKFDKIFEKRIEKINRTLQEGLRKQEMISFDQIEKNQREQSVRQITNTSNVGAGPKREGLNREILQFPKENLVNHTQQWNTNSFLQGYMDPNAAYIPVCYPNFYTFSYNYFQ